MTLLSEDSKLEFAADVAQSPFPMRHSDPIKEQGRASRMAALAALVYADLFDYPLTLDEIVKYQVGTTFSGGLIAQALRTLETDNYVEHHDRYFVLRGRSHLVAIRTSRYELSTRLWKRARVYANWLARMPYVRMVAVTGALAVDNVGDLPDIDLLVVAEHGRVWVCRRALIMVVRLAKLFRDDLCPNYIISHRQLELDQRDFFTAHELSQMVPLIGSRTYRAMIEANSWAKGYLPRGFERPDSHVVKPRRAAWQNAPETILRVPGINRLERWELARLRRKLRASCGETAEVVCTPTQCKGHTGFHRRRITARYFERLSRLGPGEGVPPILQGDFELLRSAGFAT